jgi:hypothetical protein
MHQCWKSRVYQHSLQRCVSNVVWYLHSSEDVDFRLVIGQSEAPYHEAELKGQSVEEGEDGRHEAGIKTHSQDGVFPETRLLAGCLIAVNVR